LLEVKRLILDRYSDIKAINTSHDSVILETPESLVSEIAPQVVSCLLRPMVINGEEFTVPVDAEIGERWGELKELKVA
jgi:hypothetical protein